MRSTGDAQGRLRVLLVHNAYQQRGGEDVVVEAEAELLAHHGHTVQRYQRHNSEVARTGRLRLGVETVWSCRTVTEIERAAVEFEPDVIHVHNSLPLISPSVHWAARRAGVPVVQTLHNFRLICPQAMLLRDERVCEDCVGHVPWRAVAHGCYRKSRTQSAVLAASVQTHRVLGTWDRKVTLYIALNEFCRRKFVQGGLPEDRLRVKPNFIDLPPPEPAPRAGFLFVGRLSREKGLHVLASAVVSAQADIHVDVVGSGAEAGVLAGQPRITACGALGPEHVYARMRVANALVLPSVCYESYPRTLVEAYANGLPVIASRLGPMLELVHEGRTGLLFNPGDAEDLAHKLDWAHRNPDAMARMGQAARALYGAELTGETNHQRLLAIYREAIDLQRRAALLGGG